VTNTDRVAIALLGVLAVAKLALAAHLALLPDEAYYWLWSRQLAAGYFDQPPLIAWMIAATSVLGHGELQVRVGAVACGLVVPIALWPHAADRVRLVAISALPVLFGLTLVATPDAPLLAAWAVALSAAIAGGRWWVLAGAAAGLAFESKYTGLAVLPLAIAAAGPGDWKTPWPWIGSALAAVIAVPNLAWNAQHEWISFAFQLHEGITNPHPPGWTGPLQVILDQLLVATPLVALAGVGWAITAVPRLREDRDLRIAWATSVPLLGLFVVASVGGPPEAHWPAPMWVGAGLGLANATGRLGRAADVGAWLGVLASAVIAVHAVRPVLYIEPDPGTRFTEGPLVAEAMGEWALPAGRAPLGGDPSGATPVYTERYQEAALIAFYTGIPARRFPGCGRSDQFDLWEEPPLPAHALFVRPWVNGPTLCTDDDYPDRSGPNRIAGLDAWGRAAGAWQVWEIDR
jgi:4-amino-4-deoxy-L-arabinose transferase-like glycosyltransferase